MLYYSHVNEDNYAERELLKKSAFSDLYCIVGSGERLIALLDFPAIKNVSAIDCNPEAIFLAQVKLAALAHFDVETYLFFIGFYSGDENRVALFDELKNKLSLEAQKYWQGRKRDLRKGILFAGQFEKFLDRIRPLIKIYLGGSFYKCFEHPIHEITSFPKKRWELLQYLFRKRWIYQLFGNRDEAFIHRNGQLEIIPHALNQTLSQNTIKSNAMFHLVFNRHLNMMPTDQLPPSLNARILAKIKKRLVNKEIQLKFHRADILEFIPSIIPINAHRAFYSLSDLLSFVDHSEMMNLLDSIARIKNQQSIIAMRTFVNNRICKQKLNQLKSKYKKVIDQTKMENSGMYQFIEINNSP